MHCHVEQIYTWRKDKKLRLSVLRSPLWKGWKYDCTKLCGVAGIAGGHFHIRDGKLVEGIVWRFMFYDGVCA